MSTEKQLWETKPDGKIGPTAEGELVWNGARPALDLDAIEARAEHLAAKSKQHAPRSYQMASEDVPALVAEVKRQAAVIEAVRHILASGYGDIRDAISDIHTAVSATSGSPAVGSEL